MPRKNKIVDGTFFRNPALTVAPLLLGMYLVRRIGKKKTSYCITEVEAYVSAEDMASHARVGNTPRTKVMFGPPGYWYVYLIYGMYSMLNIVVDVPGHPAAVLIRGTEYISGPGRLTRALAIDRQFNGKLAGPPCGLWIEDRGIVVPQNEIISTPRIGVEYAGVWAEKPYRFVWVRK